MDTPEAFDMSPPTFAAGDAVGAYTIVRKLGEGGMGAVYEARRAGLGKRVALKVMRAGRNTVAASRFGQEARIAASLDHPHVASCFEVGEQDGVLYIAMECLEGETLRGRLLRGPIDLQGAADVMLPVCSALAAAHERDVVHRDLKPDNIFLCNRLGNASTKVLDFGIAKARTAFGGPGLTGTGTVFGTPGYMSPEQAKDSKHVGPKSDQFSFGIVLWECVAGQHLYAGTETLELLQSLLWEPARPVRAVNQALPEQFELLLARMLERDADLRFPTMRDVGRALLPFASSAARWQWQPEFEGTSPPAIAEPAPSAPSGTAEIVGPGATADRAIERRDPLPLPTWFRWIIVAAVVSIVATLLAVGHVLRQGGTGDAVSGATRLPGRM